MACARPFHIPPLPRQTWKAEFKTNIV
jgi:hypothetical protein